MYGNKMKTKIPQDPSLLSSLARDPKTSIEVLEEIAKSSLIFLVEYVALNPSTTEDMLMRMIPLTLKTERNLRIAKALAKNPKLPERALMQILNEILPEQINGSRRENFPYEHLVLAILCHNNCGEDAKHFFDSNRPSTKLRVNLAKDSPVITVLKCLANDPSERVHYIARQRLLDLNIK
jgi:hypothetical protein